MYDSSRHMSLVSHTYTIYYKLNNIVLYVGNLQNYLLLVVTNCLISNGYRCNFSNFFN